MLISHAPALWAQSTHIATSTATVIVALLAAGLVGWLVAAALGFARARVFGPPVRWFALASLCMLIYHLHLVAFALLGTTESDPEKLLSFGAFFNLFVFIGSICAIVGVLRLTNPRP